MRLDVSQHRSVILDIVYVPDILGYRCTFLCFLQEVIRYNWVSITTIRKHKHRSVFLVLASIAEYHSSRRLARSVSFYLLLASPVAAMGLDHLLLPWSAPGLAFSEV